jgi:hypothetical protein
MIPVVIEGYTRVLGAPFGWTPETSGPCGALAIRDGMNGDMPNMMSSWEPTPEELAALNAGAKVELSVIGSGHPPVWVSVGQVPK